MNINEIFFIQNDCRFLSDRLFATMRLCAKYSCLKSCYDKYGHESKSVAKNDGRDMREICEM